MQKSITEIYEFFANDKTNPILSNELASLASSFDRIPGSIFVRLESAKVNSDYRKNVIDLLKYRISVEESEVALSTLIMQLQFCISIKNN
jgi:hypothetical protein